MGGTTMSNDSSPLARTGVPISVTLLSMWMRLWLKRKLRNPWRSLPSSIQKVPSRVMPVRIFS